MISVKEALDILRSHPWKVKAKMLPLHAANGHVLLEDILADRDFPPFDRVTMDGIAINRSSLSKGNNRFRIEKTVAAGDQQYETQDQMSCVEVMTGAVLPKGLDTVIRYEDIDIEGDFATVQISEVPRGLNVHRKGSDRRSGSVIVPSHRTLSPAEIAIAATTGHATLRVAKLPRVLVVSTGDELVAVDQQPLPHQIRTSNNYTIAAALSEMGLETVHQHLPDSQKEIESRIKAFLDEYDIIILIGGSSKGKYDFIPETLKALQVTEHFYRVKQRPGKPFLFGTRGQENFVFALPGNPVSAFMCLLYYFRIWLNMSLGSEPKLPEAQLVRDVYFKPDLTYFAQVKIENVGSQMLATPVEGGGSGDLANLTDADAFLILPEGQDLYAKGATYPFVAYR